MSSTEPTLTITEDEAEGIMWDAGGSYVAKYDGAEHRWWRDRFYVFEHDDGKLYEFLYMRPATENQDGQDVWEAIPVPCYEVIPEPVTTYVYRRV